MGAVTLRIDGMTCDGCVRAVRNALGRAGFPDAEVTLGLTRLVNGDRGDEAVATVRATIEKAGFSVTELVRED